MPDEALISQIENLLAEIVDLGGQNERTQIVPNLTVQDANPTNLDGFVIVSDDRDGDNILAKKVPSVIYTNNDLVNVLFPRGGEAVAFQQGSQSTNGNLWEIVPSTTTDIFYDKGKVGIGTETIPHGGVGWAQLALEGADFDIDGPHIQMTTDADDFPVMQLLPWGHDEMAISFDSYYDGAWRSSANTGNFQLFSSSGRFNIRYDDNIAAGNAVTWNNGIVLRADSGAVGLGTTSPRAQLEIIKTTKQLALTHTANSVFAEFTVDGSHNLTVDPSSTGQIKLASVDVTIENDLIHEGDSDTKISLTDDDVEIFAGNLSMLKLTETAQDLITLGPGSGDVDIDFNGDMFLQGSNGALGIGTASITSFASVEVKRTNDNAILMMNQTGAGNYLSGIFCFTDDNSANFSAYDDGYTDVSEYAGKVGFQVSGGAGFFSSIDAGGVFEIYTGGRAASNKHFVLAANGDLAIKGASTVSPNTRLDIGAGAMEFAEMTAPGGGAVNTARLYAVDNGAGKTQLAVIFNTGAVQVLATEP